MKTNRGFTPIAIVLIIIAVLAVGVVVFFKGKNFAPKYENTGICGQGGIFCKENNSTKNQNDPNTATHPIVKSDAVLASKYLDLSAKYNFKYKTFDEAVKALQVATRTDKAYPDKIDFYVPGKVPHEDGNPYFIFRNTLDEGKNDCLVGYMNLVSGVVKNWHDVCVIYG